MNIIFVGASELRYENGQVVLGPDSQKACDVALEFAKRVDDLGIMYVMTAGITRVPKDNRKPEMWEIIASKLKSYVLRRPLIPSDGVEACMSKVMAAYLRPKAREVPVEARCAKNFNTSGEMRELAEYCHHSLQRNVQRICLVVKDSQVLRMKYLCEGWLKYYDISKVNIVTLTFPSVEKNWFLYEELAFVKDFWEMERALLQKKFSK